MHLAKEFKERNRQSMLNVLSDSTTASLIFGILLRKTEGRAHFFRTLARFASGLSDTAKAFLIIAGEATHMCGPITSRDLKHPQHVKSVLVCFGAPKI